MTGLLVWCSLRVGVHRRVPERRPGSPGGCPQDVAASQPAMEYVCWYLGGGGGGGGGEEKMIIAFEYYNIKSLVHKSSYVWHIAKL